MKKLFAIVLLMSFGVSAFAGSYVDKQLKEAKKNTKYNSVQKITEEVKFDDDSLLPDRLVIENLKDPKLIVLSNITPIDEKLYKQKLAKDEEIYTKEIFSVLKKKSSVLDQEPSAVDFYKLYRISERLIRANNLEHVNWRIAVRKTPENVNAYATAANLVTVHTSLYDSLYTSDDALAFVIAHEMSHLLLNHAQRRAELAHRYKKIYGGLNPNAPIVAVTSSVHAHNILRQFRMMEYMADTEGLALLIKAGYDPEQAIYALKFLSALPEVKELFPTSTHPYNQQRIESAKENVAFADPEWVEEGKVNIYNSSVLPVKKSSDRVSIVISKDDSIKSVYEPETITQKLYRLAYVSYKKGDMKNAVKYFDKLVEIEESYIPYLYLSYANEYLYLETKDSKYLKQAEKSIEQANKLAPKDKNVKEQLNDLKNL